ncbi:MAG: branched-chain amino acid ABC transporter permease [Spirochaetes bacterium]|nr:branched-chain amino acid ABC transporter permease [Spirochaetota bacterium]
MHNNKQPSITDKKSITRYGIIVGIVIVATLLPIIVNSPYILHLLIITFIYMIAAVSLRTITISGQFPLAHAAFMGIGAYLSSIASKWLGMPPLLSIPLSALVTMGTGMLISFPFSRLRSLYYAIGSLFFGIGVVYIIYAGGTITGGYNGLSGIPALFPGAASKMPYYYSFLGIAIFTMIALYRFEISNIGVILKAVSQSHIVASSVGINEGWYRIMVVGVSCFFVGLAGAGYAHYNMVISPSSFNFMATLWLCMYVLIGGIGSFAGPIIGTIILFLIPQFARDLKEFTPYLSALLLLIVLFLMPKGLISLPNIIYSLFLKHRKEKIITHVSGN